MTLPCLHVALSDKKIETNFEVIEALKVIVC